MTIILNHINRENERLTTPEILPSCSKQRQNDSIIVSDPNERQRFLPENFNEKATQSQRKKNPTFQVKPKTGVSYSHSLQLNIPKSTYKTRNLRYRFAIKPLIVTPNTTTAPINNTTKLNIDPFSSVMRSLPKQEMQTRYHLFT